MYITYVPISYHIVSMYLYIRVYITPNLSNTLSFFGVKVTYRAYFVIILFFHTTEALFAYTHKDSIVLRGMCAF